MKMIINPEGWPCKLKDCPPGFFVWEGNLCFKTEYKAMETVGPTNVPGSDVRWVAGNRIDAYNKAGEHFCRGEDIEVQPAIAVWDDDTE